MGSYPKLFIPGPTHVPDSIMEVLSTPQIGHRTEEISILIESIVNRIKKLLYTDNNIYLTPEGAVLYNSTDAMGGFQFTVDGLYTSLSAAGGAAADAGFTVTAGANGIVLGFSFTGATIPASCGTLTQLTADGTITGLSTITISDPAGQALEFSYYEYCSSGVYDC